MKILTVLIALMASISAFAATSKTKTTTTTTATAAGTVVKTESVNKSSTMNSNYGLKANPQIHFSTNMLGLLNGKPNANANFFVMPKIALSVTFSSDAEKTTPLKKANQNPGTKFTVSTTQFGIGAAYYFFPLEQKWNLLANPYLVSEKKSDPVDTENNLGAGLKAEGLYLINSLAFAAGLQATSVSGDTTTSANVGVGYLF